jgi:hypothetical protein
MLLPMSKRVDGGTWCWLQSRKGEKIGLHFHQSRKACCADKQARAVTKASRQILSLRAWRQIAKDMLNKQ